jgi:hypothetical protein
MLGLPVSGLAGDMQCGDAERQVLPAHLLEAGGGRNRPPHVARQHAMERARRLAGPEDARSRDHLAPLLAAPLRRRNPPGNSTGTRQSGFRSCPARQPPQSASSTMR